MIGWARGVMCMSSMRGGVSRGVGSRLCSGSYYSSRVFFRVVIGMNSLGSSMGLASHCSGIGTMGLVN